MDKLKLAENLISTKREFPEFKAEIQLQYITK